MGGSKCNPWKAFVSQIMHRHLLLPFHYRSSSDDRGLKSVLELDVESSFPGSCAEVCFELAHGNWKACSVHLHDVAGQIEALAGAVFSLNRVDLKGNLAFRTAGPFSGA